MRRFVEGVDRSQTMLFPESLDDWVDANNPVRVIDAFVDALDLRALGFDGVVPAAAGRPSYHPAILLKLYIYGYLNRVQSSRRLEREAGRNVELMWLTGRLMPDHKTIANFRKDNGRAIRQVCVQFVTLCRTLGLLNTASVAIGGSKFKAVNNRDKNFTRAKVERRRAQIEESVARYLRQLDTADRHDPAEALAARSTRLKEKIARLEQEMQHLAELEAQMLASPDQQISLTDPDARSMATSARGSGVVGYNVQVAVETEHHLIVAHEVINDGCDRAQLSAMSQEAKAVLEVETLKSYYSNVERGLTLRRYWTVACHGCPLKSHCTTAPQRRIVRWEHEDVLEAVQSRLDLNPQAMRQRREVVEHPFGTIKLRMGAVHFLLKRLPKVRGEMALHVLAYNLTRVLNILGIQPLMAALRA